MEWSDVENCTLARLLKAGELHHPTNSAFDEGAWRTALDALSSPTERDSQLAISAIFYGREIASLRALMDAQLLTGLNRDRAVRLLSAIANQQHKTMIGKFHTAMKNKKGDPIHFELMGQHLFNNSAGQQMTADDNTAALVDSLANWLHQVWALPDSLDECEELDAGAIGCRAIMISSIERGLRDLWQGSLWEGDFLEKEGEDIIRYPGSRDLAQMWLIWDMRNSLLHAWEHTADAGAAILMKGKLPPVDPVNSKTVVKIGRWPNGRRKFVVRSASGISPEQRVHVSERDMLDRIHVGLFLDEVLPKHGNAGLTCRELNAAWWVFEDMARLMCESLGEADLTDERSIGQFAFAVDLQDLVNVLVEALEISSSRATLIVDLFTIDPGDAAHLFRRGLWTRPFLPAPAGTRRYVIAAPLMFGSSARRVETWMREGGIADDAGLKSRGKPYEAFVRKSLLDELQANPSINDFCVDPNGLKRKGKGEEIDLLIRIGNVVIVGEVKCFTSPSEDLERANYLRSVGKATAQARSKTDWASNERKSVAPRLGITDDARIDMLVFVPVVVIAQSFGIGLCRDGVPVVDHHYLRLLLGSKQYQGDTRFETDVGVIFNSVELYEDQANLEAKIIDLLRDPPPLNRYRSVIGWRRAPFPCSDGSSLLLELPELQGLPIEASTAALPNPTIMTGPKWKTGPTT